MTRRFVAVLVTLAVALIALVAPSIDAVTAPSKTAAYAYDAGANSSTLSGEPTVHRARDDTSSNDPATSATDELSPSPAVVVAAETATVGGRSVDEVLSGLSKGDNRGVYTVPDQSTLQSTFDELTSGGTPTTWKNYNGSVYELPDGTQIGLRGASKTGGQTIDIRVPGQIQQRIHIG